MRLQLAGPRCVIQHASSMAEVDALTQVPRVVDEVRERRCRWCFGLFFVCRRCDRGQAYCGQKCRLEGYARARRNANRRDRCSVEGRADHAARQRGYRAARRAAACSVLDKGSVQASEEGKFAKVASCDRDSPVARRAHAVSAIVFVPCCAVCGARSLFHRPIAHVEQVLRGIGGRPPPRRRCP